MTAPYWCSGCTPDNCAGCRVVSPAAAEIANIARDNPIDMILHCPKCHTQHIDAPDRSPHPPVPDGVTGEFDAEQPSGARWSDGIERRPYWTNPPHRSHQCHQCGTIWRPADVCTNGVASIATRGKHDTWAPA